MKLNKVLPCLAVAMFALTSCASKVDYEKFHNDALAVKAHNYVKATVKVDSKSSTLGVVTEVKGTIHYTYGNGWAIKSEDQTTDNAAAIVYASAALLVTAASIDEDDKATYYVGGGFEVKYESGKDLKFNDFGLLVSSKDGDTKISISYSK